VIKLSGNTVCRYSCKSRQGLWKTTSCLTARQGRERERGCFDPKVTEESEF
jgi:hypothetical protein